MELQLGSEKLSINPDTFTTRQVTNLRKETMDLYLKYLDDAKERQRQINKIVRKFEPDLERKKEEDGSFSESLDEFEDRIQPVIKERDRQIKAFDLTDDDLMTFARETLGIIAGTCNQADKVTKENFDNAVWSEVQKTLIKILGIHKIPVVEVFEPPKSLSK